MRNTNRLGEAKTALTNAINHSHEGKPDKAESYAFLSELTLRRYGRPDLARRVEAVLAGDVNTTDSRRELRTVAQKLDAELEPEVTTASFVPASDGGERL